MEKKARAFICLHQLLETDDPFMVFGSLVSHFRRLVLVKEAHPTWREHVQSICKGFRDVRQEVRKKPCSNAGGLARMN